MEEEKEEAKSDKIGHIQNAEKNLLESNSIKNNISIFYRIIKKPIIWIIILITFIGSNFSGIKDFFISTKEMINSNYFPEHFKSETTFNILILPFERTLEQKEKIKLEENLKKRFEELKSENKYNIDIIFDEYYDLEDFKIDKENWKNRGADLILYGDYFNETSDVNREIRIYWSLLDKFPYSFDYDSKSEIKSISKISEIFNGTLLNDIDYIIYWCLGFMEYQKHNYNKSLILFKEIYNNESYKKIAPKDTLLNFCIGSCYTRLDSFKLSIEFYDKVLKVNSNDYSSNLNKGHALFKLNYKNEALKYYNKCIDIDPQYAVGWNNKGMIFMESGQLDSALIYFDKAIKLHPNHPEYLDNKGIALSQLEQYSEAIVSFDKAIKLNSKFYYAWYNKGRVSFILENYTEAIEYFTKANELNPTNCDILIERGLSWLELENYDFAIFDFATAININNDYIPALNNLGCAYISIEEFELASAIFDKILTIDSGETDAWHNKGVALIKLGLTKDAINSFESSLRLNPNDYKSWYSLALLYAENNNKNKMLKSLKKAFILNTDVKEKAKIEPKFYDYYDDNDFRKVIYN